MSVLKQLEQEIKQALLSKDKPRLEAVRLIKAEVKNKEIEVGHELSDEEFIAVLSTQSKKHRDSIDQFKQGNRLDLVASEEASLAVVQSFLPQPLSLDEVDALIKEAIQASQASGPQDMGKVMKELKPKTTGRVDGKILAQKVKESLA